MRERYERNMTIERIMVNNERRRNDDEDADDEDRRCASADVTLYFRVQVFHLEYITQTATSTQKTKTATPKARGWRRGK